MSETSMAHVPEGDVNIPLASSILSRFFLKRTWLCNAMIFKLLKQIFTYEINAATEYLTKSISDRKLPGTCHSGIFVSLIK
jgi:hypothetical protein